LRGRKRFADLCCTGPNSHRRVDLGEFNGKCFNQLIVEGTLCC
jgi:hypothetical protein